MNKTKTPEKTRHIDIEISHLPDKEFKVKVLKILSEHGGRMDKESENLKSIKDKL